MTAIDLRNLWRLHQIDAALVEIRKRAASLDPGKQIMAQIQTLQKRIEGDEGSYKVLHAEQKDLELQQKGIEDKVKKLDKDLYGGSVVNPREVEAMQKEIESLKKRKDGIEMRLLEVMEQAPDAKQVHDKVEAQIAKLQGELKEHQKGALALKSQLESEFKRFTAARPGAVKEVKDAGLLAKYEAIRAKHDGTGMAKVQGHNCGGCGTAVAERSINLLKEDRLVTCEECHRILYYTEGVL